MSDFSRRSFLRGASVGALALGVPGLLSACGTSSQVQSAASCKSTDLSATQKKLIFSNWPEYIDVKGKTMPTLAAFEKQSGIDVTYNTDINDNNEFFGKIKDQLGGCEPIGRDIITLTDWMAARLIGLGWVQKLDHANLPNVVANLSPSLQSPAWDKHRDYSVPWQSGLTGIAYNAKFTGTVSSFEELVTRKDLKGRISLLSEMNDTMLFMLLIDGADPTEFTRAEWDKAIARLEGVVNSGQVRRFTGNDYIRDLNAGNVVACEAWSGDVIAMQYDNPDIKWVAPDEGLALWSDNMMVPITSTHRRNAERLMDYYYDPAVAAQVAAWVNYVCPVPAAQDVLASSKDEDTASLAENPLIFPDAEMRRRLVIARDITSTERVEYAKRWNAIVGL